MRWSGTLQAALAVSLATAAPAEGPRLLVEGTVEIEDEWIVSAPDRADELNDLSATVDLDAGLLWSWGGLYSTVVAEPVRDPDGDRVFGDTGVFVEDLFLEVEAGEAILRAGKFTPLFGLVAEAEPGLYGDQIAGDYELSERIGLEAGLPYRALGVEHLLTASTFVADRTALSGSFGAERERLRRGDGGVSNTPGLGSFALATSGAAGGSAWTAGVRYQGAGEGDEADEYGAVLGLEHLARLRERELSLTAELAHFPRFDGERERATVLTLGGGVELGPAWATLYAGLGGGAAAPVSRFATLTVEAPLAESVSLAAGYLVLEEDGGHSHALGLRLSLDFGLD